MDVFIILILVIVLQYICISGRQDVYLKYVQMYLSTTPQ